MRTLSVEMSREDNKNTTALSQYIRILFERIMATFIHTCGANINNKTKRDFKKQIINIFTSIMNHHTMME